MISCRKLLLLQNTLTGEPLPTGTLTYTGPSNGRPKCGLDKTHFRSEHRSVYTLKGCRTLGYTESRWLRPLSALSGVAGNRLGISRWLSPWRPANSVIIGFLCNHHETGKITHILMYIFDILVDASLKFSLEKKCWPQQTSNIPAGFHFTT